MMSDERIYFDILKIADDTFTIEKLHDWEEGLLDACEYVMDEAVGLMDNRAIVQLYVNESLLDETIVDAVLGLKKITKSANNTVKEPNTFKFVSYIVYWFLRHKPLCVHCADDYRIEDVACVRQPGISEEVYIDECRELAWKLKHINEYAASVFAFSHIFAYNRDPVFTENDFQRIKRKEKDKIPFETSMDMEIAIEKKFIYYISYRAIAPKIIEHILEGYTYYPRHGLTGSHWKD